MPCPSGAVPAGVAVIRLSGPEARKVMNQLIDSEPKPRFAALRSIRNPKNGDLIDQALVLFFPGTNSFTGEESVEFHLHGGRAVVNAMLDLLGSFCRLPYGRGGRVLAPCIREWQGGSHGHRRIGRSHPRRGPRISANRRSGRQVGCTRPSSMVGARPCSMRAA